MIIYWPTGQGAGAAGACDYPAVTDVRSGTSYGSGAYTGTLTVPAVGDVRYGTQYGAAGTEYTGTLVVPATSSQATVGPFTSQDWIPWLENITYTSVRPNSADVATALTTAAVYQLGNGESSPSYGVYTKWDIKVCISTGDIEYDPKPRDTILWNTRTYTVLEVTTTNWADFHTIIARDLILHSDLRDSGTLSRPSNTQDSAGRAALTSYTTVTSSIPCRVQYQPSTAVDQYGRRHIQERYTAYVGVLLDARAKDRFTVGSDIYTIVGVRNPERIDQLQELDLQLD